MGLISSTEEKVEFEGIEIQYSNQMIIKFNGFIKNWCAELELDFINLLPYFLGREEDLLSDHIHPNKKGLEIILSELCDQI